MGPFLDHKSDKQPVQRVVSLDCPSSSVEHVGIKRFSSFSAPRIVYLSCIRHTEHSYISLEELRRHFGSPQEKMGRILFVARILAKSPHTLPLR